MVRGLYTASSGMMARLSYLDIAANNLANIDTTAFKRDTPVFKAYPEMLIRRVNDDGLVTFPLGSYDLAPVVGKLGTGVEVNESYTRFEQGNLIPTENDFDFALEGEGFFAVETPYGEMYTRAGNFKITSDGYLVTDEGFYVLGEKGRIRIKRGNFTVDQNGNVFVNSDYEGDLSVFADKSTNEWKGMKLLDRLKIVRFRHPRELKKFGLSYYRETKFSGKAEVAEGELRPRVRQGFLEGSNVKPVAEMVGIINAQRSYEANSKVIQAEDETLRRAVNEVGRGIAG